MKRIIALIFAVVMIASLAIAASAETFMGNSYCQAVFDIKKADPANVKKDGIISEGEYEKVEIDKNDLAVNFGSSASFPVADAMADTMEYYFSWDEVNGLNFAVKYDAYPVDAASKNGYAADQIINGFCTNIPAGVSNIEGIPMDNFLFNLGINFASGWNADIDNHLFYYAVGKKIDGSSYLTGHFNQLGPDNSYEAVGGKDFEFSYSGTTVTAEWSIPFAEFGYDGIAAGDQIEFTVCATAGNVTVDDSFNGDSQTLFNAGGSWSVSLGQLGFMVQRAKDQQRAKATLLDEVIAGPVADTTVADTTAPETTAPVTSTVVSEEVKVTDTDGNVVTGEDGKDVTEIITSILTDAPTQDAGDDNVGGSPVTGDPMVIAAVVAAISACGVVVAKKRK